MDGCWRSYIYFVSTAVIELVTVAELTEQLVTVAELIEQLEELIEQLEESVVMDLLLHEYPHFHQDLTTILFIQLHLVLHILLTE